MRRSSAVGLLRLVSLFSALVVLAACAPLAQEGLPVREDSQSALHQEIEAAVAAAVPEATSVGVSARPSGLGVELSVRLVLQSSELASVDLVDRALRAAWSVDAGQSNSIELNVRHPDGAIPLEEIVAELGLGGGVGSRVTVGRQDLAARYGE